MLRQFTIDEQYICDQTIRKEWSSLGHKSLEELTPDELVKILKGEDRCSSTYSQDHPEFTKLRNQLEAEGYITTCRNSWNGDRVIKGFKLNEWTFKKGRKFSSASAMSNSIACARKHGWKNISSW